MIQLLIDHDMLILKAVNKQLCNATEITFHFHVEKQNGSREKSVIMNTHDSDGLNFLDFTTARNVFKIKQIKQLNSS